ncbi:MAG: endonuclease/exonuclease/phosphatase family protein [Phycisphaerales bacterium]|nr:endonuclease/exonuclease/phosphatase family protein [Phycisphaerales bacterium]
MVDSESSGGSARRGGGSRWAGARRAASRLVLVSLCGGYAAFALATLYRPDPADGMGRVETGLTWFSLMGTTFLPHAGMALLGVLVVCVAVRARRTALAGVPLLAMSLGPWLWSFLPPAGARNPEPVGTLVGSDSGSMLVLSANLFATTKSDVPLVDQIRATRPDVIMLQEVRPDAAERLLAALSADYASVAIPRDDNFGQAIFSRLPFSREPEVTPRDGESPLPQVRAFVRFGGREVCLWDVHLMSPIGLERTAEQAAMAGAMGPHLDGLAGTPTVVAGDFNSVWGAQPLDKVRRRGFIDAFREAGRGPGSTWPRVTLLRYAPGITLDHIAHSPDLRCVEVWTGGDTGSDHKPVFARLVAGWGLGGD